MCFQQTHNGHAVPIVAGLRPDFRLPRPHITRHTPTTHTETTADDESANDSRLWRRGKKNNGAQENTIVA